MSVHPFGDKRPVIADDAFVHDSAVVIGEVELKEKASIWPGAVVRADDARVEIGRGTAVLDLALLEAPAGRPVIVGESCIISHAAKLHGCQIGSHSLVGIGAIVLDGSEVGEGCVIAAGTLVTPGTKIPPGHLVVGVPGKPTRKTTEDERRFVENEVRHIQEKAQIYRRGR